MTFTNITIIIITTTTVTYSLNTFYILSNNKHNISVFNHLFIKHFIKFYVYTRHKTIITLIISP